MKYIAAIMTIFTCSCSQFSANINSFSSDKEAHSYKYVITPGDSNTSEKDLQFLRYSKYLSNSLISNGFRITNNDSANAIIQFKFDAKTEPFTQSESWGYLEQDKATGKFEAKTNNATTTLYPSFISLTAIEKAGPKPINLWKIHTDGKMEYYDFPTSIMTLIYLSEPYYGKNSPSQIYSSMIIDGNKLNKILSDTTKRQK